MRPEIAKSQSSKQSVRRCVHQHIRIRMAIEAFGVKNLHPTENKFAARNQSVNVITNANVNHEEL